MNAVTLQDSEGLDPKEQIANAGESITGAANAETHNALFVARGSAADLGVIVRQESLTMRQLAILLKEAQAKTVAYSFDEISTARAELQRAKASLDEANAQQPHSAATNLETLREAVSDARARVNSMKKTAWITYARFSHARRKLADLTSVTAFVGDADKGARREVLVRQLDEMRCAYILHTSTSHGCEGEERYRLIIPLRTPLNNPRQQYPKLWQWFNSKLGNILDPGAKDPIRLNYMPRVPTGATGHTVICVDDRPWFDALEAVSDASVQESTKQTECVRKEPDPATSEVLSAITSEQESNLRSALQSPGLLQEMGDNGFWSNHIGYALLSLGEKGRELFVWASEQAPGFEPGAPETWWENHETYAPTMDFRHIYKKAGELGWQNPRTCRIANVKDFAVVAETTSRSGFQVTQKGRPISNVSNAARVLANQQSVALTFDEFLDCVMVTWPNEVARVLREDDVTRVQIELQQLGMSSIGPGATRDAMYLVARQNLSNCVTAWLDQLTWDGKRRLSLLLQTGFGTTRTRYHVCAGRNMVIAMVARAYAPGCQLDEALVFEGPQGAYKSSALRIIGGEYFKELTADPNSKDFEHQLRGVWLGEFPELHAMRRADDIARIKQFLTCREDHYRPPYAREMRDYKRRVVLCGTTNEHEWLHDPTGGRRFVPIEVGKVDLNWLRENRAQLFAEAVARYKAGYKYWKYPREEMLEHQQDRAPEDPWTPKVHEYLKGRGEITSSSDVLGDALDIPSDRQNASMTTRVNHILRKLGCVQLTRRRIRGMRKRPWTIPSALAQLPCTVRGVFHQSSLAANEFSIAPEQANFHDLL